MPWTDTITTLGRPLGLALAAITLLSTACSRTGNITGEIIITTPSGSEQRAAHATVLAIQATKG